jgi:alpha-L-fucosidase
MKTFRQLSILLLFASLAGPVFAQSASTGESPESYNKRMEWFGNAKLGIFIHWGIYAVNGISESWSFYNEHISYEDYMKQTKGFTAANYDPKLWVDLIEGSGAKYTVLTTKHHDGFALWDTKAGKVSAKKSSAAKRDLITPFANEVRKRKDLHLGLYYSLLDWGRDDYPNKTKTIHRYDIKKDAQRWQKFCKFNFAQINEINTEYKPDLIWFDGDWEQNATDWNSKGIIELLRSTNPNVIVNSRIQGYGDYATPEQGVPVVRPKDKYWELCYTMNDSWGYQPSDTLFKTPQMLLRTFVDCLSMGGNMLLDIGPKADGTIPQEEVNILKEFGRWTSKHKDAIYETRAGIPADLFHGGYTTLNKAGDILYLYIPNHPNGPLELKGICNNIKRIWVVGDGTALNYQIINKLPWSAVPGIIYIDLPENVQDEQITVVALQLDGPAKLYRGEGQVISAN